VFPFRRSGQLGGATFLLGKVSTMDGSSLHRMSLSLGLSGHPSELNRCPLSGVKRTSTTANPMSASDPKRTLSGC
jgi:hypothetical protein